MARPGSAVALVVVLAIACLEAAAAHVTPVPNAFDAEAYGGTALKVSHGCDGAANTKIVLEIPETLVSVRPQQLAGWNITIQQRDYTMPAFISGENVTSGVGSITWEGELPDAFFQWFEISFKLRPLAEVVDVLADHELPNEDGMRNIYLPITQHCESTGAKLEWTGITMAGEEEPESPAPFLMVNENPTDGHGGHR